MFPITDPKIINLLENQRVPNTYWKNKTGEYQYWFRSLLQKIDSAIIWKNLPKEWNNDFFTWCLWAFGYVAIFETSRFGLTFQPCTLGGPLDWFYQPTEAIISNPKYQKNLKLHKEAALLKITPDYCGCWDIIDHYAMQLAECSKGVQMGLINTKLPMVISCKNEAESETVKKIYDKVQAGESLVIYKDQDDFGNEVIPSKEPFEAWGQDFKDTYIVHNLLEDMEIILNGFYKEIGIPVNNIPKKERLITSEADMARSQSQARISTWAETINESLTEINDLFKLKLEVEFAYECETDPDGDGKLARDSKQVNS